MTFFDFFQFMSSDFWLYATSFILILSLLVFVHEWGHYIIARACGVHVESFSIGFGKEIFGFDDEHGTRWKFSLIPLGGYVQLFGHENPAEEQMYDEKAKGKKKEKAQKKPKALTKKELEVAYFAKPVWKRSAIVFAGPAINYIFAIILLAGLFAFNGEPVTPPLAGAIIENSAADEAGFEPLDRIERIDGRAINSFEELRREMMISLDKQRHFEIDRNGQKLDIYAAPEKVEVQDRFGFTHAKGLLGLIGPRYALRAQDIIEINGQDVSDQSPDEIIADIQARLGTAFEVVTKSNKEKDSYRIAPQAEHNDNIADSQSEEYGILFISSKNAKTYVQYGVGQAIIEAIVESWDVTAGTMKAIGQMITGTRSPSELGGVIRIGALAGDMVQQGIVAMIMFTALLSINLGLINLFPIPLLDGGHLVFYAVEAVRGEPLPDKFQEYAFQAGLFFLITIMAFANINDIIQLIL